MQIYNEQNDINIFDMVQNTTNMVDTLVDIVMDYIGICMNCQQNTYPLYVKKIYGYRICVNCLWSNLSNSLNINYKENKIGYICVCDKKLSDNKISIQKHLRHQCDNDDLIKKIKCWCGEFFIVREDDIKDIKNILKKHEDEIIHIRNKDIKNIMIAINHDDKRKIKFLRKSIPVFLRFIQKEKYTDYLHQLLCFYKFTTMFNDKFDMTNINKSISNCIKKYSIKPLKKR